MIRLDKFFLRDWYLFPVSMGLALVCVYFLPFYFPPSHQAISQSYVVGYNNKVASVSLALISVLVALLRLRRNGVASRDFKREPMVPWPWLVGALLLVAAWNGGLSWFRLQQENRIGYRWGQFRPSKGANSE
jgi:hypothetical protein